MSRFISPIAVDALAFNPPRYADSFGVIFRMGRWVDHKGSDLGPAHRVAGHEPCVAVDHGWVHRSGWLNDPAGFGVELVHPNPSSADFLSRVIHLADDQHLVGARRAVGRGQRIGSISNTATPRTNWVHTHLEIRRLAPGEYRADTPGTRLGVPMDPVKLGIFDPDPIGDDDMYGLLTPDVLQTTLDAGVWTAGTGGMTKETRGGITLSRGVWYWLGMIEQARAGRPPPESPENLHRLISQALGVDPPTR